MRKSGILMPIASLPSTHGGGDFGAYAYEFVEIIKKTGFKLWQILPLNALGYGNSPYQCYSSKAMDELYISLETLKSDGLLDKVESFNGDAHVIDYEGVRIFKQKYLKEAFANFVVNDQYNEFIKQEWVYNYALFITLKKNFGMQCWNEWDEKYKTPDSLVASDIEKFEKEIAYECFIQYILFQQWTKLRTYANEHGIEIMGDIPFYVGLDSDDVWCNQNQFLLDSDGKPTFVAGVPPDYFSAEGQRWGNPIYNWDVLEADNFAFWLDRLDYTSKLFDIVRIDHFRAFDTYWQIPASCPTAIEGEWLEAPGYTFFDALFEAYPNIRVVAEDLGLMRPEVYTLRDHYNLMGMRIVQYSWNPPKMKADRENLLIYTGTHDNEPMRSWYSNLSVEDKIKSRKFLRKRRYCNSSVVENFIQYTLESNASIAIVSVVDILNKKVECRINAPGTIGSPNWEWKLDGYKELRKKLRRIKLMIRNSKRI